jgi:hypothetical protein
VTYIITNWQLHKTMDVLLVTAIITAFYFLSLGLIFILNNILPADYMLPGTLPENYFSKAFFNKKLPDEKRIVELYKVELINYQKRIAFNATQNQKRWRNYTWSLKFLFFSPIVLGIIYFLLSLAKV